jgi:hypothetical protein
MRWLILGVLVCLAIGGCAQESELRSSQQNGWNSTNLWPTDRESKGGYR